IGSVVITWLTVEIGTQQVVNANVVLGAILLIFVLFVPKGVAPMLSERLIPYLRGRRLTRLPHRPAASTQESEA
ncbi:MAG: branched-chain amino acid ABC transporter permease, partial [Alphaproteobacteria bacterium]|nr:branched-chain amino acid ABC transporter permease [Alphaproteobacteria bacterium]